MTQAARQVLTFKSGGQTLAIASDDVAEVVTAPRVTRVPQAPPGLQGLANLRGHVVPILSVEALLGGTAGATARVIVLNGDAPVGLAVDSVSSLHTVEGAEGDDGALAELVQTSAGSARLLRRGPLLGAAFGSLRTRAVVERKAPDTAVGPVAQSADVAFLQFELAGQAYALPLEQVREVTTAPTQTTVLPQADAAMLGVMALRGGLLPLVSMRALLGLPSKTSDSADKVVVASLGGASLGLVVDRVRAILRASERDMGAVPSVLNRGAGEARIDAIVRTPTGLVSVLATERIFIEDTVAQIIAEGAGREAAAEDHQGSLGAMEQFVLFRLANETYGLPVSAVREVVRLSAQITRVPRAPDFVAGVMSHRGAVVPLIDQRRRFAVAGEDTSRTRRVIVTNVDDLVAGFIVDGVEQILSVPAEALRSAPELAAAEEPIFDRVATLELDGRLVLLVDPRQLLDQAERDIVRDVARRSNAAPE